MKNKIQAMANRIKTFIRDQDGLTIVEYAVAAGLITATVATAFLLLGEQVETVIETVTTYITPP